MFFSFDGSIKNAQYIEAVVKEYEHLMEPGKPTYLFLDEVQFIEGWEWVVKRLYDSGGYKIVLSGSSSFSVRKGSGKALVGRTFDFTVTPFSLCEILGLSGLEVPIVSFNNLLSEDIKSLEKRFFLRKESVARAAVRYFECGGLPETFDMDNEKFLRYVKDSVVDKIIFRDLGETLGLRDPAKVMELFVSFCETPGFTLDINSSAAKLGVSRATLTNYVQHLKSVYLVRELYNYTGRLSKSLRKGKRYYPYDNSLVPYAPVSTSTPGRLAENAAIVSSGAIYFWRERNKEVDLVLEAGGKPVPVEVKYRSDIGTTDLDGMFSFGSAFGVDKGIVLTKDRISEETLTSYGRKMRIRFIPLWLFLLVDSSDASFEA
jgi:predicted AAA+ superfamily ATPase